MKSILAGLFLLLFPSLALAASCTGQSLTLQTVSGNVTVCMGGLSGTGPYWSQQELVDTNNAILDSAAGTSNAGGRAIAIQGITSGVAVPTSVASLPLPSNAAQETGGNLALAYGAVGALGSSAASSDTGSFNLNAMIQRLNQHLTTINATLGSPFQAGGTVVANGGGTAGSANAGVATVQGIASMTPLLVNPGTASNFGIQTQGSTTSGQSGQLIQGAVTTAAPSYTTAQTSPLSLDTSGNLRVSVLSFPSNSSVNVAQIGGNSTSTAANGTQLVGIEGHSGSTFDFGIGGASAPTNALAVGGEYNSTPLSLSNGQAAGLQIDTNGYTLISPTNITIAQASTTSGQTGSLIMGAATTGAPTDTTGKSYPLSLDTSGNLRINCTTGCSGTSFSDEGAFTAGTTNVGLSAGFFQTTATSNPLTNGQGGAMQLTANRALMVTPFDSSGNNMTDTTSHALKVEGTGTAGTAASAVTTIQGVAAMTPLFIEGNAGGAFDVATGSNVPANILYQGSRAQNAEATATTNGKAVGVAADLVGRQIVFPYANKENLVEGAASATGTASTSLIGVPGSSLFIYVTDVACFNSGTTGSTVVFQNGSGGTTLWEGYAAPGGGFTKTFSTPIGGVNNMSANTALFFQDGSSTTTMYCNANGFKGT